MIHESRIIKLEGHSPERKPPPRNVFLVRNVKLVHTIAIKPLTKIVGIVVLT